MRIRFVPTQGVIVFCPCKLHSTKEEYEKEANFLHNCVIKLGEAFAKKGAVCYMYFLEPEYEIYFMAVNLRKIFGK